MQITLAHFVLLYLCTSSKVNTDRFMYFGLGDPIEVCCNFSQKVNEAILLSSNNLRLQSLLQQETDKKLFDADSSEFLKQYPEYKMKGGLNLCVIKNDPGATITDKNMTFKCELAADNGIGKILDVEKITVNIFELPKINSLPNKTEVVEGENVVINCIATGSPKLILNWSNQKLKDKTLASSEASESGHTNLSLRLNNVQRLQHGEMYTCEAQTSYPTETNLTVRNTYLSVNYKPEIEVEDKVVHTYLRSREEIKIVVRGRPQPKLVCKIKNRKVPLVLAQATETSDESTYFLSLPSIKPNNVGEYVCEAVNSIGNRTVSISVTLNPSPPEITSSHFTQNSDYYLLGWRVKSKRQIHNVTLGIKKLLNQDMMNNSTRNASTHYMTIVFNKTQMSDVDSNMQQYWHHLSNLSDDTKHQLNLMICNSFGCTKDVDKHINHPVGSRKSPFIFKTARFDGTNKIDPKILQQPPSAKLIAAAEFTKFQGNRNISISPTFTRVLIIVSIVFSLNIF